jgi:cyclic pyranopterin phosphate synthase
MRWQSQLRPLVGRLLKNHPEVKRSLKSAGRKVDLLRNTAAQILPQIIQADTHHIFIAVTANCNLRCLGCRYGREFMAGSQLPWPVVRDLLDDAKDLGVDGIRFYGGEPLVHKDIVRMVEHSIRRGLPTWLSTNAILLKDKIDDLYKAGLRSIEIGFYGTDEEYNRYVQRENQYTRVVESIAYTRERYGTDVSMGLCWVLMRPTCSVDSVRRVWAVAQRFAIPMGVNLLHYSLPYFADGPEGELQFRPEDGPAIQQVVEELLRLKEERPELLHQSARALRSIPDWLRLGPRMRVPCEAHNMLWVGADGTVQLCYVTFKLGNLHQDRLRALLFTDAHQKAARQAFGLHCPNCHCGYDTRIDTHLPSLIKYSFGPGPAILPSPRFNTD